MGALVATLVFGSLGLGAAVAALRPQPVIARRLAVAGAWALAALSLALFAAREGAWQLGPPWIPGIDPVNLSAGPSIVPLIAMVQGALALAVTVDVERCPKEERPSHFLWLAPFLCGLVVAGLAVDQFLARYAALEALALATILIYALQPTGRGSGRALWGWYWQFRLGDAGLILLILALHRASGTFLTDPMLGALQALPPGQQLALLVGGLLAAWVKLGLPPFHGWMVAGATLPWWRRMWVTGIGLPMFGAYLLYRLGPAIGAAGLRPVLLLGAVLVILGILYRVSLVGRWGQRATWFLVAHGAVGMALAGTGAMSAYVLTLLPIRVLLSAAGAYGAGWSGVPRADALPDMGAWLGALVGATAALENRLEGLVVGSGGAARAMAAWLQRGHTGRLRINLLWAYLGVLAMVAASLAAVHGAGGP